MGEAQPRDVEGRMVERRSRIEARVAELCLIALLLLTIVAIVNGRIGFTGEWAPFGGMGHVRGSHALGVSAGAGESSWTSKCHAERPRGPLRGRHAQSCAATRSPPSDGAVRRAGR